MVLGYGHDDRVCAYTSALATFAMENPQRTSVCLLVDKEEVGATAPAACMVPFFENTVAEILNAMDNYSELKVRRYRTVRCSQRRQRRLIQIIRRSTK